MNDTTIENRKDDKKEKLYTTLIGSLHLHISAKTGNSCQDDS